MAALAFFSIACIGGSNAGTSSDRRRPDLAPVPRDSRLHEEGRAGLLLRATVGTSRGSRRWRPRGLTGGSEATVVYLAEATENPHLHIRGRPGLILDI